MVPRMLLRNFQSHRGFVFAYEKKCHRYFTPTLNKVFVQKDRYTQTVIEREDERYEVELHLAEIESLAAPVIDRIYKCRKAGLYPPLTEEEGDAVKRLFITMFLRTDHHAVEIVPTDQYEQLFRQEFARHADVNQLNESETQAWQEFQNSTETTAYIREQLIPDIRATVAAGMPPEIAKQIREFMANNGLLIASKPKGSGGFIIGDCGGVYLPDLDNQDRFHRWLPISRELVIGPFGDTDAVTFVDLSRKEVARINSVTFETSNAVVASRRSDLDYLVSQWVNNCD